MSFKLNNKDYKTILEFYNKKIPTSSKNMREEAEKIISMKLCRCIKKVKKGQNKIVAALWEPLDLSEMVSEILLVSVP